MPELEPDTPEFSRVVAVEGLAAGDTVIEIEASEAELAALAARFGLIALERLAATVRLRAARGGKAVRLQAEFNADVVQTCVVTLDPVPDHVTGTCDIEYFRGLAADSPDIVVDEAADVEPLDGGSLDIGEIVATEMALSLNPYPRSAEAPEISGGGEVDRGSGANSPFQALASLKRRS